MPGTVVRFVFPKRRATVVRRQSKMFSAIILIRKGATYDPKPTLTVTPAAGAAVTVNGVEIGKKPHGRVPRSPYDQVAFRFTHTAELPEGDGVITLKDTAGNVLKKVKFELENPGGTYVQYAGGTEILSHDNNQDITDEMEALVAYGTVANTQTLVDATMNSISADSIYSDSGYWVAMFPALGPNIYMMVVSDSASPPNSDAKFGLVAG